MDEIHFEYVNPRFVQSLLGFLKSKAGNGALSFTVTVEGKTEYDHAMLDAHVLLHGPWASDVAAEVQRRYKDKL